MSASNLRARAWLLPLVIFLLLTIYQLRLPGPNYDEAVEARPAVQILQNLPVEAHRNAVIHLFGKELPLMIVDYVGALNSLVLLLYFKVGGIGVITMRLWPITVGAFIVLLTYLLGKALFDKRIGLMAATLLAVQPSFVFFARQGIYVTNTTIALMLAIWLVFFKLVTTGKARYVWIIAFMAGLGLWAKFIMLWPLAATGVLIAIIWPFRDKFDVKTAPGVGPHSLLTPRVWTPALLAFLAGLSPFILFNIKTGATFKHFMGTLNTSYYGVDNANYLHNLAVRWGQMHDFLQGDHFWYLGGTFADVLAYPAFLLGVIVLAALLIWQWKHSQPRTQALRAFAIYVFFALLLLQTPLTPTALWYTHLAMFSPVLALAIAASWGVLFRRLSPRMAILSACIFITLLGGSGLRADVQYHRALARTGGFADHSDAVYRLDNELLSRGVTSPYALDWGLDAPLVLVSGGRINPIEIFGYEHYDHPDASFTDRIRPLLLNPNSYFLVHAPDRTNFPGRREALMDAASALGIKLDVIAIAHERSGAPHTELLHPVINNK